MDYSDIIYLSIVALLLICLHVCLYARRRRRFHDRLAERQWPGHGIDVSSVSQRVERLRYDYISELNARPSGTCIGKSLLASARRTIVKLSYFQTRDEQDTVHTDHENTHAA
jgi:hypothetical protein